MVLASSLKSEDEFMICFLRFNTDGLDESSPYINISGHDKSSPYINIRGHDKSSPYRIDYYTRGY